MKFLKRLVSMAVISLVIYLAIALGLIFSQAPGAPISTGTGLDFSTQLQASSSPPMPITRFQTRDGAGQGARVYPSSADDGPLLVLVHGSGWHGLQFERLARSLQSVATVIVPDLRGHGEQPQRRGDVDYIGQLEDDLADLIVALRKPNQQVVLAGHSSGGGLVVRFAGSENGHLIDAAILMAPYLKYDAPTTRPNSGGWARVLTRRLIGLSMLNTLGVTGLNHLVVIQFNFPPEVREGSLGHTVTDAYSYRLNTAYAPRGDYLADVASLPEFLLIVGRKDESFVATEYEPLMSKVTDKGRYLLVDETSHLDIVDAPQTLTAIQVFLSER